MSTKKISIEELDGCTVRVVDGRISYHRTEQFTDGTLIDRFIGGDRNSISEVCAMVAKSLKGDGLHDVDLIAAFIPIFECIGKGMSPNDAFEWTQSRKGNPVKNVSYRDWDIRKTVQDLMKSKGIKLTPACNHVSADFDGEFTLKKSQIFEICKGLNLNTPLPMPEDIYPLPDESTYRKISPG